MRSANGDSVLAVGSIVDLGVSDDRATVWFGKDPRDEGSRFLHLQENPAFELSFWCGTCAFLFQRQEGPNQTVSLEEFQTRLAEGLGEVDSEIVRTFGELLGADSYQARRTAGPFRQR